MVMVIWRAEWRRVYVQGAGAPLTSIPLTHTLLLPPHTHTQHKTQDMEQLRLKLKESFENVSQDPRVAAQMAPFINDDFKAMMEDTAKFREEIQKVRAWVGVGALRVL